MAPDPLTEDRIEERTDIVWHVDWQACHACGKPLPVSVAGDPEWFIDTEATDARDASGAAIVLARILCPACW